MLEEVINDCLIVLLRWESYICNFNLKVSVVEIPSILLHQQAVVFWLDQEWLWQSPILYVNQFRTNIYQPVNLILYKITLLQSCHPFGQRLAWMGSYRTTKKDYFFFTSFSLYYLYYYTVLQTSFGGFCVEETKEEDKSVWAL